MKDWYILDFTKYKKGKKVNSYYGEIGTCPKCNRLGAVRIWTEKEKNRKRYPEKGDGRTIHKVESDGFLGIPIDECAFPLK